MTTNWTQELDDDDVIELYETGFDLQTQLYTLALRVRDSDGQDATVLVPGDRAMVLAHGILGMAIDGDLNDF